MKRFRLPSWGACAVLALAALLCSVAPLSAQETKSSDAAIKQYRAAVAFQNRQVYDLAVEEWLTFLKNHTHDPLAPKARHYLGVCYFQLQKYPEAQAAFQKVAADFPRFELLNQTLVNLGLTQFNLGQQGQPAALEQAVATFATLLEKFPQGAEAPLALYYQAESLYGLDRKPQARAAYAKLLEHHPQHALRPKALYGLGVAQEETGAVAEAGQTYETFLKEYPDHALATEVGMRRGETLLAQGQHAEAEKRFAAAAQAEDFEFADYALLRQAACNYELQQFAQAGQLYAQLVSTFPQSPYVNTATLAAGKCFFLAGDQPQAQSWLDKGRALGGDAAAEAAHWLARSFIREKKPAEALKTAEAALAGRSEGAMVADLKLDQADALYEMPDRRGESIGRYAKIVQEHPEHEVAPQAAYMAAYAALGAGDFSAAVQHAETFLQRFPEHELLPDVRFVQAESQVQLRQYEAAEANFEQLLANYASRPETPQWLVRRALCLYLQKKYPDVVDLLSPQVAALKAPAALAEAQFLLGSSLFEQGKYAEALAALQASLAADPAWRQADETLLVLARAQGEAGQQPQAIATLEQLITKFPNSLVLDRAYFRLGELQDTGGAHAKAVASYGKVLENWPDSPLAPYARFGLGWAHLAQQQYEPAVTAMSELLQAYPQHELTPRAHYARAMALQQQGKFDQALADAEEFLKSNPTGAEQSDIFYIRGLSLAGLKKYADAAESFQTILENNPQYPAADKVLYELAWAHLEQNQKDKAVAAFTRLAEQHPESELAAESHYRVAEYQYQDKKYPQAAVSYYAAYDKAGKGELAEKAIHKLGWAYFQQKDYERALQSYRSQLDNYPAGSLQADARAMIGECLYQQKKYAEALPALEAALQHKPSSDDFTVLALLHAGQSAGQLEKWEQSLQLLGRCAREFPESPYQNEVLYEQAWAQQNLGQNEAAKKLYHTVAEETDSVVGARARFMLGELQFLDKQYEEAVRSFFRVAYGYGHPDSPEAYRTWQAEATFEAARCCELLKKNEAAKKLYRELIERYPQSEKLEHAKQKLAALDS